MQFSGDSKPCQQWNGPYVEQNVMTHKTLEWNGFHFVVRCWGWVTSALASKWARALQGGVLSSLPALCSLGNIFPLQHFYLCQLPCWMLRDIGSVWTWAWSPGSAFLVMPVFLASGIYPQKTPGPKTKQRVVVPQKDDSGVKAMFKQHRIFHIQTGLRNCRKLFFFLW